MKFLLPLALLFTASLSAQVTSRFSATCEFSWEYADFGLEIGEYNNMLAYDYGNDGTTELITNSRYLGEDNTYAWSVIKYDPVRNTYMQVYTSKRYEDVIVSMILQDVTGDGIPELLLIEKNNLHVIDIHSHETLATVLLAGIYHSFYPAQVRFGDADNDGENEIVVGAWNRLYLVNTQTFAIERVLNRYAALFDVGNVDDDPAIEIAIYTGEVLEMHGTSSVTEYNFHSGTTNSTGHLLLEDIDNDGRQELIISLAWDSLLVYDLESETLKYGKRTDGSISSITVTDIEDDNSKEILFTADQWGDLYCWRASTGVQRWSISNKGHEGRAIVVADIDDDNVNELIWTTTEDNEGSIHVYNATTRVREWYNKGLANVIHSMEIVNIDDDPEKEIVTIGSKLGNLKIFNAATKEIEYESAPYLIPDPSSRIRNILIDDYKKDGDLDIIVGTDDDYQSAIYVVDGNTHVMEASHVFPFFETTTIYDLAYADIDNDNTMEFIILTAGYMIIINSNTFEIERMELVIGNPVPRNSDVITGNIDSDPGDEIIVSNGKIFTFDDGTFAKKESALSIYHGAMLFDWDNDGRNEIIATTKLGGVHVLETEQLTPIHQFQFVEKPVAAIDTIDLNQDGVMEFIAASDGFILFFNREGKYIYSQKLDGYVGVHDALIVTDLEGDNIDEVFLGTERGVVQLSTSCAGCLWYENEIFYTDPKCNEDNGMISFSNPDTSFLYLLNGEPFNPPLEGLEEDKYDIFIQNDDGCIIEAEVNLTDRDLRVSVVTKNQSCSGDDDGLAYLDVDEVNPPYTVQWSNGEITDTIKNLSAGIYEVILIDSLGCIYNNSIEVRKDTLVSKFIIVKPACRGVNDGSARVNIWFGESPYTYVWNGTPGPPLVNMLSPGIHIVDVTDGNGCTNQHIINIPETFVEADTELLAPDCNMSANGSAKVSVTAGNAPYRYTWSDNSHNSVLMNAGEGFHSVIVHDLNQCYAYDTVYIPSATLLTEIIQNQLLCNGDNNGTASIQVLEGMAPYSFDWSDGSSDSTNNNLSAGVYSVTVTDNVNCIASSEITFTEPSRIRILLTISNDDESTPEPDGSILATILGGIPPYQFIWSSNVVGNFTEALFNGIYTLTVIDWNGCSKDTIIELPYFPSPSCLDGGVVFSKQSQIDSFPIYYPDCHIIEGNVRITGPEIQSLEGLENIQIIQGHLEITYTTSLSSLDGLGSLQEIGGDLIIDSSIILSDLNDLQFLSKIGGKVELRDNFALTSLSGLTFDTLLSHLHIFNNDALINLQGLNELKFVGGRFRINGNSSLQNLSGLSSLAYSSGFWIGDNESLSTLEGASSLSHIGPDGLVISRASFLENFTGFENLEKVDGQFYITESYYFKNFEGLESLDTIEYFVITHNPAIQLTGLESLVHIRDGVNIEDNDAIVTLAGLSHVTFGKGAFHIAYNDNLETLSGLENFREIDGHVNISDNPKLTDISAMENIDYTTLTSFDIVNMPLLSECSVKSICDYLTHGGNYGHFEGNASGCNSEQQVLNACITSVEDKWPLSDFFIYPNPTNDKLEVKGIKFDHADIEVLDISGSPVKNFQIGTETIYVNELIPGFYFLKITQRGFSGLWRFIKI